MWTLIESILFVLLIGNGATVNSSSCRSKDLDSSICNELIKVTGLEPLDRSVHNITSASTNYESFAESFYLIIFNPGSKESRSVSLTDVFKDCSVLQLSGTSTKLVWSGYSGYHQDAPLSHIHLGFTPSQMQQYADASDSTIIAVDWETTGLSCYDYFQIVFCIFDQMADLFAHWLTECVDIETLDLIGHSMGAQIIGYIAQHLNAAGTPARALIALDPGLSGFRAPLRCEVVQDGAAKYVAVYHCDPGGFGTKNLKIGNASYLINPQCDFRQVGCGRLNSSCNHAFCLTFFLELTQNVSFTTTRTDNPSNCPGTETIDVTVYEYTQNGYFCVNTNENGQCPSSN